ncbi:hypothetical protein [Lentzea terrae]|uniref:hypothetical protein n=1 Tax=Lentzea terrae TaxID=2200761 RepID=UPI000DD4B865|nr:hypothetical protein [Lentzea terrae]
MRGLLTPQRILIGFLCLIALVVCCGLAWWQWQRFESASGTFQNLGYVLQWPLFGLFPLFMVWRFRRLARQRRDEALSAPEPVAPEQKPVTTVDAVKPAPVEHFDDPEDAELAAYNRMLADLNARDGR